MPFGIPSEGFWGKKELAYQHVHMFWAFWVGFAAYSFFGFLWVPALCGVLCGLAMETYQHIEYLRTWTKPKKIADMIRDFCFWTIGGCLNYIIIFVGV